MPSIINATTTNGVTVQGDNSGSLQLATNNGTTAVTITTGQNATFAQTINTPNTFGFKNRIINGAMVIDQRNAGASITVSSATNFNVDRFKSSNQTTAVVTLQQVSDAPIGFVNSSKFTVTTADSSIGSTEICYIAQLIEGFNVADLGWGTANAKTVTLSFWVKSSITGLMGGAISNTVRSYPYSYTINSANTWEYKTVTIAGDTSGTWNTTNSIGMVVYFNIGCGTDYLNTPGVWVTAEELGPTGQVNVISTLNATWQVTGVQLEVGSTATSFDYRPYGTEFQLCQRYYQLYQGIIAYSSPNYNYQLYSGYPFPVPMRTTPSIGQTGLFSFDLPGSYTRTQSSASIAINVATQTGAAYVIGNFSSLSTNQVHSQSSSNSITFSAEI
jgi:hypothetical protein